ncbi:MAG: GNAT family N-acetyltransferase [Oscillospiraceae bacterium]|nr:GNAT family N-acetyltransferase [Oscillospiraceae bacterium]
MTTDLSVCQDIFNRDPVRYVDMTEAVRRGIGAVLHASPSAALVGIPSPDCPEVFDSYLMSCADMDAAHLLCGLLPDGGDSLIAAHEDFYLPLLQDRFGLGFFLEGASFQAAYLGVGPCPIPDSPLALRQLAADDLPQVSEHYKLEGEGYLRFLLERGRLFGGFLDGTMIGFAGFHTEGAMGLLEVFPPYRRRGFASVLEQYLINRELALKHIPFGQVVTGNAPSLALQRSLGMTLSEGTLYWLARS